MAWKKLREARARGSADSRRGSPDGRRHGAQPHQARPRRFRWGRGDLRTFRMERRGWFRTPVSAEIAITMLANDHAVDSVTLGANGLAEGLAKGAVHVSMSTISVALSERLTTAHEERGQRFVAAPVFGRPDQAQAGKLFVAAAGAKDVVERIRPALDAIGQRSFVIGEAPAQANLVKLTGNFLITCVIESLAEAFALTAKGGIETSKVYELLTETLFAAPVYKTYGEIILAGRFSPVGFKMALGKKDNRLVQRAAEKLEVPLPFAAIVRDRFLSALAHGDGELDWSAIAKRAAEDAGGNDTGSTLTLLDEQALIGPQAHG